MRPVTTLLTILGLGVGLSLILTPLARALGARVGIVDCPDGRRKVHSKAIPVAGGIAILCASTLAFAAVLLIPGPLTNQLASQSSSVLGLLLAVLVICLVGVADDCNCLRGRHKLLGQFFAAIIVVHSGLVVRSIHLFDWDLELGLLAVPFTVLWLLAAINSLNFLDGMDGLLSSIGLIISLALAIMAILFDQWIAAGVALALAGALLGFLFYNLPPASIFLGDSGSMLIGLVLGTLSIQAGLTASASFALAAPATLLTIPFFDTAAAIIRRKLTGRSIYTTDRGHLHHCLLRAGFSDIQVLLLVSTLCVVTVAGSLASLLFDKELIAVLVATAVIGILTTTHLFGYAEFSLVKKRFISIILSFLRGPGTNASHHLELHMQGTGNWPELWQSLMACAWKLNLVMVRLNVNAPAIYEGYHGRWDRPFEETEESNLWHAELPLMVEGKNLGRVEVTGMRDGQIVSEKMAAVARLLEDFELKASTLAFLNGDPLGAVQPGSIYNPKTLEKVPARS
jgi:UDP-GlcNAc:undecaprenyl-phosphate GlcNAc-1-phosphate transferase